MALYSDFLYIIHIKFILVYLAMFLVCLALISVSSSYSSYLLRPFDLGKDIGSCAFGLALASYMSIRRVGDPWVLG